MDFLTFQTGLAIGLFIGFFLSFIINMRAVNLMKKHKTETERTMRNVEEWLEKNRRWN